VASGAAWVFHSIPYAAAPVGRLRWQAPVPLGPWDGVRDATQAGPSPVQSGSSMFSGGLPGNRVSDVAEDCLTVDIWAPRPAPEGGATRPVLFWICGGAFLTGGSAVPTYDGARLAAEHDVVVVSVNYRLGALGFLWIDGGAPNCGLLDQMAALRWTRSNVAAFGGDPDNVTLLGESAGAGSLLHILPVVAYEGLARRAIIQSAGVPHTQMPADAERVLAAVVSAASVSSGTDLLRLPAEAVLELQEEAMPGLLASVSSLPFHPVVDGELVRARPADTWPVGDMGVLFSWTAEELRLYPDRKADEPTALDARLRSLIRHRIGSDPSAASVERLRSFYAGIGSGADAWAAAQTDILMRLPPRRMAMDLARSGSAVHVAQFDWGATGGEWRRGAFHAIDLPFTFGTLETSGWLEFLGAGGDDDRGARRLADLHMASWAAYARTGDPGWPAFADGQVMRFDTESGVGADPLVETAAVWDSVAGEGWPPI
jgi:para-nitrobenzyl esterase